MFWPFCRISSEFPFQYFKDSFIVIIDRIEKTFAIKVIRFFAMIIISQDDNEKRATISNNKFRINLSIILSRISNSIFVQSRKDVFIRS